MKRPLLLSVAVLMASLVVGPGTAFAWPSKPPEVLACVGAGQSDGSFESQQINQNIPGVGLGLGETLCVDVAPNEIVDAVNGIVTTYSNIPVPTTPPSAADIQKLVSDLSSIQPGLFAPLTAEYYTCRDLHVSGTCNAITGGVLNSLFLPLGDVELQGDGSSYCWNNHESGTGTVYGANYYNVNWTADYSATSGLIGQISGTATPPSWTGDTNTYNVTGAIGPSCGAGAKALVMVIS